MAGGGGALVDVLGAEAAFEAVRTEAVHSGLERGCFQRGDLDDLADGVVLTGIVRPATGLVRCLGSVGFFAGL